MLISNFKQIKENLLEKYSILDSIDMSTNRLLDLKNFLLENKKESFETSERLVFFKRV